MHHCRYKPWQATWTAVYMHPACDSVPTPVLGQIYIQTDQLTIDFTGSAIDKLLMKVLRPQLLKDLTDGFGLLGYIGIFYDEAPARDLISAVCLAARSDGSAAATPASPTRTASHQETPSHTSRDV
jgi:hypothetical protein